MNFQIYTMYVNRKDLLQDAIRSVGPYENRLVVLDNSLTQDLALEGFSGEIFKPHAPLFCNQSYNLILKLAQQREQPVFFIMHSDAVVSQEVIEKLLVIAETLTQQQRRWGVLFTSHDVLCLCNTEILKDFLWDQYLPLYYTDVDYYYRLRLAGVEVLETHLSVGHQEGGSTTLQADLALKTFVQSNYSAWQHYYREKWGGERDQERYTQPFNQTIPLPNVSVTLRPAQHG